MGPQIRPSAPLVHATNSTKHNTFCILEPKRQLFDANGHSQALVYAISCENTKSSVWHKENLHLLPAMHSILGLISATCGAKFDCEPLSHLTLRLWVRPLPSSKPFKNVDGEHTVGPCLIQYDEVLQKSVDFNRSLLFHSVEGSSRPVFGLRLALQPLVSASTDGIITHYVLGGGWEMRNLNV